MIPLLAYYASASPTSQQHSLAAPASSISHHVEILDADHVRVNGRTYIAVDSSSRRLQSQPAPGPSPSPSHEFEGSEPEKDCAPEKGLTPDDGADFWIAVGCTLGCVCTAGLFLNCQYSQNKPTIHPVTFMKRHFQRSSTVAVASSLQHVELSSCYNHTSGYSPPKACQTVCL